MEDSTQKSKQNESTLELINSIVSGDTLAASKGFNSLLMSRIANAIEDKRVEVAQSMFENEEVLWENIGAKHRITSAPIDQEHQYQVHTKAFAHNSEWKHNPDHTFHNFDDAKAVSDNLKKGTNTETRIKRVRRTSLVGPTGKLPEAVELDEGKANPLGTTALRDVTSADMISKDKEGNHVFRKGFFYRHGGTSEGHAKRITDALKSHLPDHDIQLVNHKEVWKPFRGGASVSQQSHWAATVKITPKKQEKE